MPGIAFSLIIFSDPGGN